MDRNKTILSSVRKTGRNALVGLVTGATLYGSSAREVAAAKATNVVEWWISPKSTNDSNFYIPEHNFTLGSTAYLYIATDTTKAVGTNFSHIEWTLNTPILSGKPNMVSSFQTNFFTASTLFNQSYFDSAWNGFSLDTGSTKTKMDQTTNSSGVIVNNYATISPSTTGFHDVTTNFPSASQGGLMAVYKFTFTSDPLAINTMTNFRLTGIIMTDTVSAQWNVSPTRNIQVINNSDFSLSAAPAVPEAGSIGLVLAGGAVLGLGSRRRYRTKKQLEQEVQDTTDIIFNSGMNGGK